MNDYVILKPTRTSFLDIGRICQAQCAFCYYIFQEDHGKGYKSLKELQSEIKQSKDRGNTLIDITGGEPTIHPDILDVVDYIHTLDMRVCIITNGLCGEERQQMLINHGVDLFRISMHGLGPTHDRLTGRENARNEQMKFLDLLEEDERVKFYHINYVLVKDTQEELIGFAETYSTFKKFKKFSIINFLPHYEWGSPEKAVGMIADLRIAEKQINKAFPILESRGIGCDLRYYPMCRIDESLRRTISNDYQCMFDFWEWDYGAFPKTKENYRIFGENISRNNEEKGEPCCRCNLRKVCGGINRAMNNAKPGMVDAILEGELIKDPFYYRKYNIMTQVSPGGWK